VGHSFGGFLRAIQNRAINESGAYDGLTDVAVGVHDLGHGEPVKQEVAPVLHRALAHLAGF
jgi:hypothetical protein